MNQLYLTQNKIESTGWYNRPCDASLLSDNPTYLMGPNGFELTELEIELEEIRERYEPLFLNTDWQDGAKEIFKRKDDWINLGFFPQSKYKCEYFGLIPENFGEVRWL
jgi:hypothetical protein